MQAIVYNKEGKNAGVTELPEAVFAQPWNADLLHEVILVMQGNARAGTAHTKTRGEVRGGGKKPWKQKGTGRARHGSRRSPIWRGGGITFGPRSEKNYGRKLNRNARAKALAVAFSQKLRDNELILLDTFALGAPRAKEAKTILGALAGIEGKGTLATKRKNAALIVLAGRDEVAEKSFQNFGNVLVVAAKDVNPLELLTFKYVIVAEPATALDVLEKRAATKATARTSNRTPTAKKPMSTKKVATKKTPTKKVSA